MGRDRRKEIGRHLSEEDLDWLLSEVDDPKVVRRLTFVKNLYKGDSLEEAADRVASQPYDNSRRMWWYIDDSHHERLLVQIFEPAVGFQALNEESVVSFPEDQTKEQICKCLERVREQNPAARILLVLDNHFAHTCEYTRKRAHQLGIGLVFLPDGSLDLNPIEQVWKSLKWQASPLIVESANEFRALVSDLFEQLTP